MVRAKFEGGPFDGETGEVELEELLVFLVRTDIPQDGFQWQRISFWHTYRLTRDADLWVAQYEGSSEACPTLR